MIPSCILCGEEGEDLVHFLLHCKELQGLRNEMLQLQRPMVEDPVETVGEFLFGKTFEGQKRKLLHRMWLRRRRILEVNMSS